MARNARSKAARSPAIATRAAARGRVQLPRPDHRNALRVAATPDGALLAQVGAQRASAAARSVRLADRRARRGRRQFRLGGVARRRAVAVAAGGIRPRNGQAVERGPLTAHPPYAAPAHAAARETDAPAARAEGPSQGAIPR